MTGGRPATVVVLNGAPRTGKSSIAEAVQRQLGGTWLNLGVDVMRRATPPDAQPGIGLRPGEPIDHVTRALWSAFWDSVAAHARLGLNVVADVGVHDSAVAVDAARRLADVPVLLVGVRCPAPVVLERRRSSGGEYAVDPCIVDRWERAVHGPIGYDLELDTSASTPEECAAAIAARLAERPAQPGTFLA